MLHWHNFSKMRCTLKRRSVRINRYRYLLWAIIEGKLLIDYHINALIWYKTCCIESESRNFDFQWTFASCFVKHNQFYRDARQTPPLYWPTEDMCIRIYIFKHGTTFWTICGDTKIIRRKVFELDEPPGLDCVYLPHKDSVWHISIRFINFRHIEFHCGQSITACSMRLVFTFSPGHILQSVCLQFIA